MLKVCLLLFAIAPYREADLQPLELFQSFLQSPPLLRPLEPLEIRAILGFN